MYDLTLPGSTTNTYITNIRSLPIITAEREKELGRRLQEHNDLDAAHELVMSHLRYVIFLARKFSGYNIPICDLIQQGNYGLMTAIRKFDYTKGIRLITFAVYRIKAEILDFIIRNWRIVNVATCKAQRKLFFNLRKMTAVDRWLTPREIVQISSDLNVTVEDVAEMESRLYAHDESFDPLEPDDDTIDISPVHLITDESMDLDNLVVAPQHHNQQVTTMMSAIETLNEREQYIIRNRYLLEDQRPTLATLATQLKVSTERIRQIENTALNKLRLAFNP